MKIQGNLPINNAVVKENVKSKEEKQNSDVVKKYDIIDIQAPPIKEEPSKIETLKEEMVAQLKTKTEPAKIADLKSKVASGRYFREGEDLVLKIIL